MSDTSSKGMGLPVATVFLVTIGMGLVGIFSRDYRWALAAPLVFVAGAIVVGVGGEYLRRRREAAEQASEIRLAKARMEAAGRGPLMPHSAPEVTRVSPLVPPDHPVWAEAASLQQRPAPEADGHHPGPGFRP